MVHTEGMTPDEFQTFKITPASATKRKSFARRRAEELAKIQAGGWEIVAIEPERFLRSGDKVTVRRPAREIVPPRIASESTTPLSKRYVLIIGAVVVGLLTLIVIDVVL